MLDELQEVGRLRSNKMDEISGNLQKLFDENSRDLHMVLSFTTGDKQTTASILGEALMQRVIGIFLGTN